jgi:hypothetical protein
MDFDGGLAHGGDRVANRVAIVRVRAGVDHDPIGPMALLMKKIYDRALVVGLEDLQLKIMFSRKFSEFLVQLLQGQGAINLWLALPKRFRFGPWMTRMRVI